VRSDINDTPPNPNASPTPSDIARRPKPWDRAPAAASADSAKLSALAPLSAGPAPWQQAAAAAPEAADATEEDSGSSAAAPPERADDAAARADDGDGPESGGE